MLTTPLTLESHGNILLLMIKNFIEIFIPIEHHGEGFSSQNMCRPSRLRQLLSTHVVTYTGAASFALFPRTYSFNVVYKNNEEICAKNDIFNFKTFCIELTGSFILNQIFSKS
jgi:hypothetical protein